MDYCKIDSNGKSEIGAIAPSDIPIEARDKSWTFTQEVPSKRWVITHPLGKCPSVAVSDPAGNTVIGDVKYLDEYTISIDYNILLTGKAYLN